METRVALIGIMVENAESVEKLNDLLHQYRSYIIGRMGVPYREKGLSIISVVLDAPMDKISSLSGKLGMLDGVSTKQSIPGGINIMKKFTSFILAAALGMALLTGCGHEKPAETSAAGSAESQTAAASSNAEASVPETSEKRSH